MEVVTKQHLLQRVCSRTFPTGALEGTGPTDYFAPSDYLVNLLKGRVGGISFSDPPASPLSLQMPGGPT